MVSTLVQEGFRLAGKAHETNMSQVRTLREKEPRVLALQGMHACVCVYMCGYMCKDAHRGGEEGLREQIRLGVCWVLPGQSL